MLTELLDVTAIRIAIHNNDVTQDEKDAAEEQLTSLEAHVAELSAERDELQSIFDANWKADMRAVERWRAVDPAARELIHPDRADLVVWLLEQHGELEDALGISLSEVMKEREKVAELEARLAVVSTSCRRCNGFEELKADCPSCGGTGRWP